MNMWATPFLKFNTYSIIFYFLQWTIKYNFFEKYYNFVLKMHANNQFHNILTIFDVLPNFPFTTNETMGDYYL